MKTSKTPSETYTEQVHLVNQSDLNGNRRLFGGTLLSWIDMTAGIVACAKATYSGNTSLEVRVDSYVERTDGSRTLINTAYVVLVALDGNEKPCRLPRLVPETDAEISEFAAGEKRRQLRKARKTDRY